VCVLMFVAHEMPLYATQFQYTLTGSGSVWRTVAGLLVLSRVEG